MNNPQKNSRRHIATSRLAAALFAVVFCLCQRANGANAPDVFTSGTDMTVGGNWSLNSVPGVSNDAVFNSSSPSGALSFGGATATYGSLDDTHTGVTTTATNTSTSTASTLTLGGAGDLGNSISATSSDLIYVAGGASTVLNLVGGSRALNIVLGQSGGFDVGASSILNIGTAGAASTLNLGGFGLTMNGAGTANITSVISNGSITINAGTTVMGGANTFSGGVTLNGGTLQLLSVAGAGTGTITASGGILENQGGGGFIGNYANPLILDGTTEFEYGGGKAPGFTGNILLGGTGVVVNVSSNSVTTHAVVFMGVISDGGNGYSLTEQGGTLYLGGANTYTGLTTISAGGTLILGGTDNSGGASQGGVATGSLAASGTIAINGNLTFERSNNVTQGTDFSSSPITGTGSLTQAGSATSNLVLNAANTYTGATTISTGTLTLSNQNAVENSIVTISASNDLQFASGLGTGDAFTVGGLSGAVNESLLDTSANPVTLTVGNNNDTGMTFSGVLSGGGAGLTKVGTGTQTLIGANSFTGATTVNGGTLIIGTGTSGGLSNSSAISVVAGTLAFDEATGSIQSNTISDSGVVAGTETTGITNTLSGPISGNGAFTQSGAGVTILSGSNSYSGGTNIPAGTIIVSNTAALGAPGAALNLSGGTVDLQTNTSVNAYNTTVTANTTIDADLATPGTGITQTLGTLSIGGNQLYVASGSNATIGTATLAFGATTLTSTATASTTLNPNTAALTLASVAGSANSTQTDTLALSGTSVAASSITGSITDGGNGGKVAVAANGSTWILGGANSYSGATTVAGGTLELNGANSSAGTTSISTGTIELGTGSDGGLASGLITMTGGVFQSEDNNPRTITNNLSLAASAVTFGAAQGASTGLGNLTFSNVGNSLSSGAGPTITVNNSTVVTLEASGTAGLTGVIKNGFGTLVLDNLIQSAGTITLNGGTLQLAGATALSAINPLTINAGVFDLNGTSQAVRTFAGIAGTLLNNGGGASVFTTGNANTSPGNFGGNIINNTTGSGTVAIINDDGGVLDFSGNNTYSGGTTLQLGELSIGSTANIGGSSSAITFAGGGLQILGTSLNNLNGNTVTFTSGAAASFDIQNAANVFSLNNILNQGTGAFTKNGAGTLVLTKANTYTGLTTVNGGVLRVDASQGGSLASTSTLTLGGGTLYLLGATAGTSQTVGVVTLSAGGSTITVDSNTGSGTTTLTLGALTATAAGGTLDITSAGSGTSVVKFNTNASGGILGAGRVVYSGTAWASNSGAGTATTAYTGYTVGLPTSGASSTTNYYQVDAPSTLTASESANTLQITTTQNGDVLGLGGNTLTLTTGGLLFTGANNYSIGSSVGDGTLKSNVATNSDLIIQQYGTGTLTVNSVIANGNGASTLTKAGTGTLVLADTNSYTGQTYIDGGIVSAGTNGDLGAATTGASLNLNGGTLQATASFSLDVSGTTDKRAVILGGNGGTFDVNGNTLTVSGIVSGLGSLTAVSTAGGGTLALTGVNTFTGGLTINGPTVQLGAVGALGVSGVNTVSFGSSGGDLQLNGEINAGNPNLYMSGLSGGANAILEDASATSVPVVLQTSLNSTFAGVIRNGTGAGVLSFTKSGAGALTLSNNDTYTGATNVDGGALIVSGSLSGSSSTTVINATLGGTGLISNAVTVGNGQGLTGSAMIEPATATTTGTLTTGALTLNSDAAYVFNLNSTAGAADEIVATSLSLNASAEFLASDIAATSTALAANTQFVVLQTSNPFTGTFVNLPDNSDITIGANTFLASYDTPDELTLTVVAIPEPGTYATLLSGIAMLAFWRRARRGLGGRFSKKLSI